MNNQFHRAWLALGAAAACALLAAGVYGQTAAKKPPYFIASQVDWVPLLPPPPAAGSAEQRRDIQAVLDLQAANRSGPRREQAIKDTEASCGRIAEVLGTDLDEKKLPKSSAFLQKAANEADTAAGVVKARWKRPRPYMISHQVERLGDMAPGYLERKEQEQKEKERQERAQKAKEEAAKNPGMAPRPEREPKPVDPAEEKQKLAERQKNIDTTSYPSGHATFGTLCAIFLSEMVPEKQAEIFARADLYRESRMIVGAHFRTDIEAGRALATAAAAIISQNAAFQKDLNEARAELRAALNLPAALPAPEPDKKN